MSKLLIRESKLKSTIFLAIIVVISLKPILTYAGDSPADIVILNYGFKEAIEFCSYKHHGSYSNISTDYQNWYSKNKSRIEGAQKALEKEASTDPVKAKKLPMFEQYARGSFQKTYIEMSDKDSAMLCFTENAFSQMFEKR